MDISYFYTFRQIVRSGSYTKAGRELGYAQSSVTTQVKKLEKYYNVKLFERNGQSMQLTQPGEELYLYVMEILDLYEESRGKILQTQKMKGTLKIGTVESLAACFITSYIKEFKRENPELVIQLESGLCPDLKNGMLEGKYDVAVLLDRPFQHPDLVTYPLRKEKLIMVASPHHRLFNQGSLSYNVLSDETLILTEKGCSYRTSLEGLLKEENIHPRSVLSFTSLEAIKQCVMDELGVALLPEMTVQKELEDGRLICLPLESGFEFVIQLVYQKKKWLSPSIQGFINLLLNQREM
ncbi:LysR family transcriptional regulator [Halobacillus fulvus]|nr:LysR family transcriptional regulator [Halobacillus fulvus]